MIIRCCIYSIGHVDSGVFPSYCSRVSMIFTSLFLCSDEPSQKQS